MNRISILAGAFLTMIGHAAMVFSDLPPPFWIVPFDTAIVLAVFEIFVSIILGGYLFLKLLSILHDRSERPRPRDRFWDEGLVNQ